MHIQRSLFLSLTASLAAVACAEEPPRVASPPQAIDVSPPPPIASASAAPSSSAPPLVSPLPTASAKPRPAPTAEGIGSTSDDDDGPSSEGGSYSAGEGRGATALQGCGRSAMRFDPKKTGCKDSTGSAGACSRMKSGGSCGSFPFPREECNRWLGNFKAGVAERAVSCALKLSAEQVCDACYTYRCGYEALMSACYDASAAADCATIKKGCPSVKTDECVAFLSGMSAQGRSKMVSCMSGRGCGWGLYSCSEGMQ